MYLYRYIFMTFFPLFGTHISVSLSTYMYVSHDIFHIWSVSPISKNKYIDTSRIAYHCCISPFILRTLSWSPVVVNITSLCFNDYCNSNLYCFVDIAEREARISLSFSVRRKVVGNYVIKHGDTCISATWYNTPRRKGITSPPLDFTNQKDI